MISLHTALEVLVKFYNSLCWCHDKP